MDNINNITRIDFPESYNTASAYGFTQWDQGQKLEIRGLDISNEIVEVHFSLDEYDGKAKRRLGTVVDGVIHADIPAFVLEGPGYCNGIYLAYAWVYVSDEESAETIRKIELEITARSKPDEYVTPEELSFLQQLEAYIGRKVDKSGHAPNMFLGTDEEGNVVAKESSGAGGKDGASAYEIALANGFKGTEEEWLESLKGEQGADGVDGKSAYKYAQDGGYTGTEEEFSTKLAQDIALTHDGNGNVTISGVAVFVDGNEVEY